MGARIGRRRLGIVVVGIAVLGELLTAGVLAMMWAHVGMAPASGGGKASAGAGPSNMVQAVNAVDGRLRVISRVQVGRVTAPQSGAVNIAQAINTCAQSCDTLAVAFQVNIVDERVTPIAPQNAAVAVNAVCTGCHAVALAIQFNIGTSDPMHIPAEVDRMVAAMNRELAVIDASGLSVAQAESGIRDVLGGFQDLAVYLTTSRNEAVAA
ncbi:MAG TPA: hypothetical protein VFL29_03240 [Candidatus Dormibacteraeota bacterium]|nr:hypothetical protein [Candidatus Dormibacteraeota bacterium]